MAHAKISWLPTPSAAGHTFDRHDPRHGTSSGYSNMKCRCAECKAAWNTYMLHYIETHPDQREKKNARERARRGR